MLKYFLFIIFIFIQFCTFSQSKIDSLYTEIELVKEDSAKLNLYIQISKENFEKGNYINFKNTIASINKLINLKPSKIKINNYYKVLSFYKNINLYDSTIETYNKIATEYIKINDTINYIKNKNQEAYNKIIIGLHENALKILYKNLKISENKNYKKLLSETYFYLGYAFKNTYLEKAKKFFKNSLKYNSDTLDAYYSKSLNEIGNIYSNSEKANRALPFLKRALKIRTHTKDKNLSQSYSDMAFAYSKLNNFYKAILYMHKCIDFEINKGIDWKLAEYYSSLGYYYMKAGKMANAEKYLNTSLEYAKIINIQPVFKKVYSNLYIFYKQNKNYKTALQYLELSKNYEDTILSNNTIRQITELEKKYNTEKQASKLFIMNKKKETTDAIIFRQKIIGFISLFTIILLIFLLNSAIKSRKKSKKINKALLLQNEEIKQKNFQIEKHTKKIALANNKIANKNFHIRDNIKYARRIQKAMLPSKEEIKKNIPENFIIYKPKEIVSGDFYSIKEINNKTIIVVGDSTGHGVSGGFMSVLGMSLINDIIKENILEPAEVLNTLRKRIINSLHQKKKHTIANDGMDLAFCVYDKELKQLSYAGAQISLYIANKKGINKIKANMMTVGVGLCENKTFTQKTIKLVGNETFYLFSDGYPDQFGGKDGKKFMIGNVKKMLIEIKDKPLNIQKNYIEANLKTWQAGFKQIDDILFIGFKLS